MLRTAEARWFLPGRATRAQIDWFTQGAKARHEARRIDRYLIVAGCGTLGAKLRQGRLELKALASAPCTFRLKGVAGRKDQWVKWSLALGAKAQLGAPWASVEKSRLVLPEKGCDVELAGIRAFGQRYSSLGFEAESAAILERTLARFFRERGAFPGARLALGRSLSYPVWLAQAARASSPARRTPIRGRRAAR